MIIAPQTLEELRHRPRLHAAIVAAGVQRAEGVEIESDRYLALALEDVAVLSGEVYKRPNIFRPGDLLSVIIRIVSGRMTCPRCWRRRDRMNRGGWKWCIKNRGIIWCWLMSELDNMKSFQTCGKIVTNRAGSRKQRA
jgi:hypothetical protein